MRSKLWLVQTKVIPGPNAVYGSMALPCLASNDDWCSCRCRQNNYSAV